MFSPLPHVLLPPPLPLPLLLLLLVRPLLSSTVPGRQVTVFRSTPDSLEVKDAVSAVPTASLLQCAALCSRSTSCAGVVPSSGSSPCRLVTSAGSHGTFGYLWAGRGTWLEAVTQCRALSAVTTLVSVGSAAEGRAVQALLTAAGEAEAHLALYQPAPDQDWGWVKDTSPELKSTPVHYTQWASGEPNQNHHSGGTCTVLKSSDGAWYDRGVSDGQVRPILCKFPVK